MLYELMFKISLEMLLSFKMQMSPVGGPSLVVMATVSSGYHVHRFRVKGSPFNITLTLHTCRHPYANTEGSSGITGTTPGVHERPGEKKRQEGRLFQ